MARRKPVLTVILAPQAENELDEIYRWNLEQRNVGAADAYIAFLKSKIKGLAAGYDQGKPVEGRPDLLYLLMKKRMSGDGHIAVYSVFDTEAIVEVLHIFHTKHNWENKL